MHQNLVSKSHSITQTTQVKTTADFCKTLVHKLVFRHRFSHVTGSVLCGIRNKREKKFVLISGGYGTTQAVPNSRFIFSLFWRPGVWDENAGLKSGF